MIDNDNVSTDEENIPSAFEGEYANYVSVGSTQTEFYIDFFHVNPVGDGGEEVIPVRRILVSPMLIRGVIRALEQEVSSYEMNYHMTLPTMES
jgi:hypothetical protein